MKSSTWGGEGDGTPLQYSCLENPMGGGAWSAAVRGVTLSRTRLRRLSSSSSVSNVHCPLSRLFNPLTRNKILGGLGA